MSEENYRFISLKVIIDRLMDDPIMADLNIDSAVREAIDCIQLIANPQFLNRQGVYLLVEDYRASLPANLVRVVKANLVTEYPNSRQPLNSTFDPYYKSYAGLAAGGDTISNIESYKIQGDYMYLNFKEGKVHLAYDAIPVDTGGFIMIPDDTAVVKAVEFYIKEWHYNIKYNLDKVKLYSLQKVEENKRWYMGKAQSAQVKEGLDTYKSLSNILSGLIPTPYQHETDYRYLPNREYRKIHR